MTLNKELIRINKLEGRMLCEIKKIKRCQPSRIVKRGKGCSTMYALVPLQFRKRIKEGVCISKMIEKRKTLYLIFEVKKK